MEDLHFFALEFFPEEDGPAVLDPLQSDGLGGLLLPRLLEGSEDVHYLLGLHLRRLLALGCVLSCLLLLEGVLLAVLVPVRLLAYLDAVLLHFPLGGGRAHPALGLLPLWVGLGLLLVGVLGKVGECGGVIKVDLDLTGLLRLRVLALLLVALLRLLLVL